MHPVAVAQLVLPYNQKQEVLAAALLHDVVEDTNVTIKDLHAEFGDRISIIVDSLTRDRQNGEKETTENIMRYIIKSEDEEIALIKIMDRIHNLSTLQHMSQEKAIRKLQETYNTQFLGIAAGLNINIERILAECLQKNGLKLNYLRPNLKLSSIEF